VSVTRKTDPAPDYRITMRRSPDLSEEECDRRIHQAYQYILSWPLPDEEPPEEESDAAPDPNDS